MKRYRLSVTTLRLLILFLLLAIGIEFPAACSDRQPSVTDDCLYCQLYGKHFRTRIDLYLFQESGEPHYKYFGVSGRATARPRYLPARISRHRVGHTYGTARILAVVPAGSELIVETATHEVSVPSGQTVGLMCRLLYQGKEVFPVSAEFIQIHTLLPDGRQNPNLDPAIVESQLTRPARR
jgi:hypothetical protein